MPILGWISLGTAVLATLHSIFINKTDFPERFLPLTLNVILLVYVASTLFG